MVLALLALLPKEPKRLQVRVHVWVFTGLHGGPARLYYDLYVPDHMHVNANTLYSWETLVLSISFNSRIQISDTFNIPRGVGGSSTDTVIVVLQVLIRLPSDRYNIGIKLEACGPADPRRPRFV